MIISFYLDDVISRGGSVSPPVSPDRSPEVHHQDKDKESKLVTSPTKLPDQKPFRGFDITSLIRKDDDKNGSCKPDRKSPVLSPTCSPNISVGPPQSPPSNPYSNLFNSGLYQQYLGQLLANSNNSNGLSNINPMLLQAQLAMASYNNHANLISERLKQNRFSPYTPPVSSLASSIGSTGLASAFKALGGSKLALDNSPPVSPPHSTSPPPNVRVSPGSVKSEISPPSPTPSQPASLRSDIKSIENMINGLNGSSEGRFSLSHSASQPAT